MLNQIILVGRLTRNITINKSEKGTKVATIPLAVPRSFKNMDGTYDTDFIDCIAFENIATNTAEYCKTGDIIGVRGRVQSKTVEDGGQKNNVIDVIAEKVTFLSSNSNKKNSKEEAEI